MDPVKYEISCTPVTSSAAAAAAAALSSSWYDVFLSFRGEDTRKNFTDHLYTALTRAGIRTFRDNESIHKGENISAEIHEAIQNSRISLVVFSKHYASSRWCLDELVQIMERKRSDDTHVVIPVFYDVDPSHVRKQTGTYETAFATHENRFQDAIEKVKGWRAVLRRVADLSGMALQDGHEAEFIIEIVMHIKKKLDPQVLNVTPFLVGRNSLVNEIDLWLHDGSNKVDMAMIYGMGGMGKTELAKIVYNQNHHKFKARSFVANIREISGQPSGLIQLQKQLLSDLLNGEKVKIRNADEGTIKIKSAVQCCRVFIILDDVDDRDAYKSIIGMQEWFYAGSKIVITTRNKQLVRDAEKCQKFAVNGLSDEESLKLLSWHAFQQDHPVEGYMKCSKSILKHCAGLPLALKVLGSSLSCRSSEIWEDTSKKLENVFESKIHKVLRISYDGLNDDHDKNLFLDIACFFVGKKKEYVLKILEGCEYSAKIGVQNLVDNCFLSFSSKSKIEMHQVLRDMGREIVRQKAQIKDPSRIWQNKYALDVLMNKSGTSSIRGLSLDMIGDSERRKIETKSFQMMRNLRLLRINHVKLIGGYREFPKSLVWLCWHGYPLESLPTDLCLEKLVVLEMCNSKLKHNWKRGKLLKELEFLDLSNCHGFVKSPDFTGLSKLQRLMLKECLNLVEINDSIGFLTKLIVLNLKGCKSLQNISSKICRITTLNKLILSNCSKLKVLPPGLDKLASPKFLYLDGTAIGRSESSTPWFSHLLFRVPKSRSFSVGDLPCFLVELKLHDCNLSDDAINIDFQNMHCLTDLSFGGNSFKELPESISSLSHLQQLHLINCQRLEYIPNFSQNELDVTVQMCPELVKIDGWLELRPMSNADVELINSLGLYALEADEVLQLSMEYMINGIQKRVPIQVLHESEVWSIFLPSADIPSWYRYCGDNSVGSEYSKNLIGSSRSYHWHYTKDLLVPLQEGRKLVGFNICVVYEPDSDLSIWDEPGTIWIRFFGYPRMKYTPKSYAVPEHGADMLWLSHWRFDCMSKSDCDVTINFYGNVKRWGVDPIYEHENQVVRLSDSDCGLNPWNFRVFNVVDIVETHGTTGKGYDFSMYVWSNGRLKLVNPILKIHPSQTQSPSSNLRESRNNLILNRFRLQNLSDMSVYSTVIIHYDWDRGELYSITRKLEEWPMINICIRQPFKL